MRSVLGYSIFVIGLAFLIQAFFPGSLSPTFGVTAPPVSSDLSRPGDIHSTTIAKNVQASRLASFSPGEQLTAGSASSLDVVAFFSSQFAALKPTPAIAKPAAGDVAARDVALGPWRSAVVTSAADTSAAAPKVAAPLDSRSRVELARAIQSELKRVGCYGGAIDGSWGAASKRAMVAFIERVNASLPLGEPDDILLLLVKSHAPGTCGVACPVGQTLAPNNRCVPDAILAHAGKPARPAAPATAEPAQSTVMAAAAPGATPAADDRWPLPGRMGIGGPELSRPAAAPANAPLPANTSKWAYTDARDSTQPTPTEESGQLGSVVITQTPSSSLGPDLAAKPKSGSGSGAKASSRKNRYAGDGKYRAVQHLFEHPLGRL